MKIKVIKYSNYLKPVLPVRKHYNDVGADVYSPVDRYVAPGETVKIGLGFGVRIPDGHAGFVVVRSSMAAQGVDVKLPPIDPGYTGEIHAVIYNGSDKPYHISEGDRIGQLVIVPCIYADFVTEIDEEERGTGAFGSTGV